MKDSTHKSRHVLDLVITRSGDQLVRNVGFSDPAISDHCVLGWETHCLKKSGLGRRLFPYENFVPSTEISLYKILGVYLSWSTKISVMSWHYLIVITTLCIHYSISMCLSRNVILKSDLLPLGIQITSTGESKKVKAGMTLVQHKVNDWPGITHWAVQTRESAYSWVQDEILFWCNQWKLQ